MKKLRDIALGIITAIGGFIDAGQLLTNTQAGAMFRYSLLWTVPVCVIIVSFYEEMAARVSMSTGNALFDAVRQRLGFRLALVPLIAISLVNLLTLVAELAGMSLALELATRVDYRVWVIPCALSLWLILWKGTFSLIENGASVLGLFVLVYVWAVTRLDPPWRDVLRESWTMTRHEQPTSLYLFTAVSLVGAFVSPFQVLFYSSGAVEEGWGTDWKWANRLIAWSGNIFGGAVAACVLIVAAVVLYPQGETVEKITQAGEGVVQALGQRGLWLFIAALLFCSMAAGLQVALSSTYAISEYFGWHWKKDEPPAASALFHITYMLFIVVTAFILLTGADPSKITQWAMAFNAVALPLTLFPLLLVARDVRFTKPSLLHGPVTEAIAWVFFVFLCIVAAAGIPLLIITGGGGGS